MLASSGRRLIPTEDGIERPLLVSAALCSLCCHVALDFLLEFLSVELATDRVLSDEKRTTISRELFERKQRCHCLTQTTESMPSTAVMTQPARAPFAFGVL